MYVNICVLIKFPCVYISFPLEISSFLVRVFPIFCVTLYVVTQTLILDIFSYLQIHIPLQCGCQNGVKVVKCLTLSPLSTLKAEPKCFKHAKGCHYKHLLVYDFCQLNKIPVRTEKSVFLCCTHC